MEFEVNARGTANSTLRNNKPRLTGYVPCDLPQSMYALIKLRKNPKRPLESMSILDFPLN